jgi:hypothetical protein
VQLKEEHMEVNVSSTKLPPTSSSDEPGPSNRGQHMGLGQLTERKIFHQGKKLPMVNDLLLYTKYENKCCTISTHL